MKRQSEPTEQLLTQEDFGGIYRSRNSPQQNNNQRVEMSGAIAIGISMLAFGGVIIAAITIPAIIESRSREAVAVAVGPLQAKIAALEVVAYTGERQSKLAEEHMNQMRNDLAAQGLLKNPPH